MSKAQRRKSPAMSVLHFFLGLIFVAILVGIAYFFLQKMDYSDRLEDPNAEMRPYVDMTAAPQDPLEDDSFDPWDDVNAVDLVNEPTATPTIEPTPTAVPTAIPTATPEPTPTPSPTPVPTAIPADMASQFTMEFPQLPEPAQNPTIGLTTMYISEPNDSKLLQLQGYAYVDKASFDGTTAELFIVVTRTSTGDRLLYKTRKAPGISGDPHEDAACKNAANTDFECIISVEPYANGDYTLGVVIYYDYDGKKAYSYHEFNRGFSVEGKKIVGLIEDNGLESEPASAAAADPLGTNL